MSLQELLKDADPNKKVLLLEHEPADPQADLPG